MNLDMEELKRRRFKMHAEWTPVEQEASAEQFAMLKEFDRQFPAIVAKLESDQTALNDAAYAAVGVARYCWEAVAARLFGDPAKSERIIGAAISRPRVTLVSAKAFRDRLAKRERPVVFPSWRMCPTV